MIDLDELRKLAEAATPGPWHFHQDDGTALDISEVCIPRPEEDVDLSIASLLEDRDGAFIAAANPATVLALLDRVERAEAATERIREAVSGHPECDRYSEDDVISCGWKSAYASVVAALDGAPEPEPEWEYGTGHTADPGVGAPELNRRAAEMRAAAWNRSTRTQTGVVVRRRKAGPWETVEGESKP